MPNINVNIPDLQITVKGANGLAITGQWIGGSEVVADLSSSSITATLRLSNGNDVPATVTAVRFTATNALIADYDFGGEGFTIPFDIPAKETLEVPVVISLAGTKKHNDIALLQSDASGWAASTP